MLRESLKILTYTQPLRGMIWLFDSLDTSTGNPGGECRQCAHTSRTQSDHQPESWLWSRALQRNRDIETHSQIRIVAEGRRKVVARQQGLAPPVSDIGGQVGNISIPGSRGRWSRALASFYRIHPSDPAWFAGHERSIGWTWCCSEGSRTTTTPDLAGHWPSQAEWNRGGTTNPQECSEVEDPVRKREPFLGHRRWSVAGGCGRLCR